MAEGFMHCITDAVHCAVCVCVCVRYLLALPCNTRHICIVVILSVIATFAMHDVDVLIGTDCCVFI